MRPTLRYFNEYLATLREYYGIMTGLTSVSIRLEMKNDD